MPLTNRVDPFGDLHAVSARGMFTGNRGCLVDEHGRLVRHHVGRRWITCVTTFRNQSHPLDAPRTWTPLFFLDDAVALAAGHRPCALCRRNDYDNYRLAVATATGTTTPLLAGDLDRTLQRERLRLGTGVRRSRDRILWQARLDKLPAGTVVIEAVTNEPHLLTTDGARRFGFDRWQEPTTIAQRTVVVLTPPTSVAALEYGYTPVLHSSAGD